MNYYISINSVTKRYQDVIALDKVNINVKEGELIGIIGPDGAGKTTLFRIIATLIKPDNGYIKINNYDVVKDYKIIRKKIGYVPGVFSLYQDLTVEENIKFFSTIYNIDLNKNYELIKDIFEPLQLFKKRITSKLSGGMKQKLALACSLIHKPELLILDEPTTGIDPISRNDLWDVLLKFRNQGVTIVVSTPYMDEASKCDKIALISEGKILVFDTPERIIKGYNKKIFSIESNNLSFIKQKLSSYNNLQSVFLFGNTLHYIDKDNTIKAEELAKKLRDYLDVEFELEEMTPTIEDCFMELTTKIDLKDV